MKIALNKYLCGWCNKVIDYQRRSVNANNRDDRPNVPGRHTVTATLRCPTCGNAISQRDKNGIK